MIYDASGNSLKRVYDKSGNALNTAYDASGNVVYRSDAKRLKIMTYNVGQWYTGTGATVPTEKKSEYYALHSGIFERHRPDILFLQEYLNTWCADGSSADELLNPYFDNRQVTTPQGMIGHAIATNGIPISNYQSHQFTTNKGNYPSFESAEVTIGGKTLTIINTHNDYTFSYQQQEVTDLLAYLATLDSFILCGDFNIDLSVEETTGQQYINSVKRFLNAGYHVGNCVVDWVRTYFGGSTATGGKFTDQVVTSADIEIESIYADETKLTDEIADKIDHLPLIAELIL